MATWPSGLPAPQKKISITPGDTRVERKLQSGRTEFRRFGDGKPDQMKVLFRLLWTQWDTFKEFYERDLNLSLNWFSASWLAGLGYSDHKAKFLGYPREVARQGYYVDVVCTLMIQKTAWIIGEDTEWPCATTGGEPPPSGTSYVYGGYNGSGYLRDCDQFTPNVWVSMSDLPVPGRWSLAASTIGSSGYVFYGHYSSGDLRDCDEYTPDVWVSKTDAPANARYGVAASTIGNSGYVYGVVDCEEYTPDVWVSKTDIPAPSRWSLAASTIGSSGYVYGGGSPAVLRDCDEYTPDVWVSKTDMPVPARRHLAASTIGSSGYVYGGSDGSSDLRDYDEYTPDVWVSKGNMPVPARRYLAASTIGDSGYIYGGRYFRDCDQYTPNVWVSMSDLPAPDRSGLAASTI